MQNIHLNTNTNTHTHTHTSNEKLHLEFMFVWLAHWPFDAKEVRQCVLAVNQYVLLQTCELKYNTSYRFESGGG